MTPDHAAAEATPTESAAVAGADDDNDAAATGSHEPLRLVDWEATAHRLRRSSLVLLGFGLVAWVVTSAVDGQWTRAGLGNWLGLALLAMFVVEVVVVGGSAVRGLLRAGDAGERLSHGDVGLLPPARRRDD